MTPWGRASRPSPTSASSASWATTRARSTPAAASSRRSALSMDFHDGDLAYRMNFARRPTGPKSSTAAWAATSPRTEAHALAAEVNEHARAAGRHLRAQCDDRASWRARDPSRRRPLAQRARSPTPIPPTVGRGTSASPSRPSNLASRPVNRSRTTTPPCERPTSRTPSWRARRSCWTASEVNDRPPRRREAPGEPDPHAGRRRSPAPPPADPRSLRPDLGLLRGDARRAWDRDRRSAWIRWPSRASTRSGSAVAAEEAYAAWAALAPTRSPTSTPCTSTSRARTCRRTTAAPRTSAM